MSLVSGSEHDQQPSQLRVLALKKKKKKKDIAALLLTYPADCTPLTSPHRLEPMLRNYNKGHSFLTGSLPCCLIFHREPASEPSQASSSTFPEDSSLRLHGAGTGGGDEVEGSQKTCHFSVLTLRGSF